MNQEPEFDYPDLEGKPATVPLNEIAHFTEALAEDLGRRVGHLHLKSWADVWTSDPEGVRERLRVLKEEGRWDGFLK